MSALATGTVVLEIGAVLLLLGGWWRNAILILALAAHSGIGALMGLPFDHYRLLCLLMLDWSLLADTARSLVERLSR